MAHLSIKRSRTSTEWPIETASATKANFKAFSVGWVLFQVDPEIVDQLPIELLEQYPWVRDQLLSGELETIPKDVLSNLSAQAIDRIPDVLVAGLDPQMVAILGVVAVASIALFVLGVIKAAVKAAFFFFLIAAGALGWLYFMAV